jgi:endonuclease/exonuclease/phosphatase family metal-dependent hydrolase
MGGICMSTIRVVAWNIAEGTNDRHRDQMDCLNTISRCLVASNADIVLLNEVCIWNAVTYGGVNQITWLAQHSGYVFLQWTKTATLPRMGAKYVAVLSRIPLLSAERIQHSAYVDGGGYATLHVTANINGWKHHIFSTRFDAHNVTENMRSHETIRDIIAAIPNDEAVILGGDFNTGARGDYNWPMAQPRTPDYTEFVTATGLRNVLGGVAWTNDENSEIDHLLVRGPYAITRAESVDPAIPDPNPSDHGWVFAELAPLENVAYEQLGDSLISSSPAACSWAPGRLDVFARGTDLALWHKAWDGHQWSGWMQLDTNPLFSAPAAISWGPNRIDVFVHGMDLALWHKWWDGHHWSGYEQLGTELISSSPAACSWASGRLDVFARGTDNALWHKWWNGNQWSRYEQLGTELISSSPAACSWGPNRIDVFVRGTDNTLYHRWWNGNQWSGYEQLGAELISSSPAVCSWASGRLDVFARSVDGVLVHKAWDGNKWSGWEQLGANPIAPDPAAVSWGSNRIDVFVRGTDSALYHRWWDGAWRP